MFISLLLYSTIIILTSVLAEFSVKIKENYMRYLIAFFMLLIPSFFAGIRYDIGTDYFSYINSFNRIEAGETVRFEFGFKIINLLVSKLGGNVHVLFFVVSFLTLLFVYLTLFKYKSKISVGLGMLIFMLLYYNSSFNGMRQILAIAILLFSFTFIYEKKPWRFLLTILLATSVHLSSIIVAPFYYLYNNISKKNVYIRLFIYFGTAVLIFNYDTFLDIFIKTFPEYSYYSKYLPGDENVEFGVGQILMNAPYVIPGLIFSRKFIKEDNLYKPFYFFLLIGVILKFSGYIGGEYINRIADNFFIASVIVVPYYYRHLNSSYIERLLGITVILFVIFMWFYDFVYMGHGGTFPYESIFGL